MPLSTFLNFIKASSILHYRLEGVPYALATSGRSGTRFGLTGVRQASSQLHWEEKRWPWQFALADRLHFTDYGDLCYEDGDSSEMVTEEAGKIIKAGKTLLPLGGDHFITLPLLRAAAKHHGKLALLHFDAHTDTEKNDAAYNHGSMFFHAPTEGLIDPEKSVQVGIRTEYDYSNHAFSVLDAAWANNHSAEEVVEHIRAKVGASPIYLSFDIDCLDPAYAPGTGTPGCGRIKF